MHYYLHKLHCHSMGAKPMPLHKFLILTIKLESAK